MKSLNDYINERWTGADDGAEMAADEKAKKLLQPFVDWAKENKGTRKVKLEEGYVVDSETIDGNKYKWIERGDNSNGWDNWLLDVKPNGGSYRTVGPNYKYISIIKFDEWNELFESLYTDYKQHPINKDAWYDSDPNCNKAKKIFVDMD